MEQIIKKIRQELDGLAKVTASLPPTREVSLAKTSFEISKMMLGKVLSEIGAANPYPESKNPGSQTIEPTADSITPFLLNPEHTHISHVKEIRQHADRLCNEMWDLITPSVPGTGIEKFFLFRGEAFIECQKAMMWLGMELGRIRDVENATAERAKDVPQSNGPAAGEQAPPRN